MRGRGAALVGCLTVVALVAIVAGCQTALPDPYLVKASSDAVYLVLEQNGAATLRAPADPFAPTVPNSGGTFFDTKQAPTTGLTNILARLQGGAKPAPYAFTATSSQTMYMDLGQAVTGTVWVSNSLSVARPIESGIYRVTLRVNGNLAGGMDFPLAASAAAADSPGAFAPIHFSFAPEVTRIQAGDKVSLEVTQLSGLADLRIGTGGAQQSHARIQFYRFDPIAGATYLEKNRLVIQGPESNLTGSAFLRAAEAAGQSGALDQVEPGLYYLPPIKDPQASGPGLAVGAAFLMPLVWTSARGLDRRKTKALLAVALLAVILLSGCTSKGDAGPNKADNNDLPPEARPSVDQKVENIGTNQGPKSNTAGVGEIAGVVRDWRNLTMQGAYVAILGTSNFAETDALGKFLFTNVTAGKYVLRVDALEMRSLEESITVQAGKRTLLSVKMAPLDPTVPDKFAHIHDEWGGKTEKLIIDKAFTPATHKGYLVSQPSAGAPVCVPWSAGGTDGRSQDDLCSWPIPFELDTKVPPGAGALDVTISWTGDQTEMGIRAYLGATRPENNGTFLPRGKGEVTHIVFFPNEADPGHQGFTNWVFDVYVPSSDPTTFGQQLAFEVGEITVKVLAKRTVIPFEPGHPDLWGGADRIKLFDGEVVTYSTIGTSAGMMSSTHVFRPAKGLFVPSDAKRIEGTFNVESSPEHGVAQTFGLVYKPANVPAGKFPEGVVEIPLQGSFPAFTFSFDVKPEETDQPYQTTSNFFFYPTAETYAYRGGTDYTLSATVYKT